MSHLTVVRHGQASFFSKDYDQLSEIGIRQARLLGQHWRNRKQVFNEVYVGPRLRQQETAEHAGAVLRQAGVEWPEPTMLKDLDEYDLDGLTNHFAKKLAGRNTEFAQLVANYQKSSGEQNRLRDFQRMFETLLRHWQNDPSDEAHDLDQPGVESWSKFQSRVRRVIERLQNHPGRGRSVVLFTSGGFIGTAVQQALGVSDATALELNWRIRNSSITEFVFTSERFTLDCFNTIPHLMDPQLWTHR